MSTIKNALSIVNPLSVMLGFQLNIVLINFKISKSIDELQFVIKYSTEPSFISDGTVTPVQTLSHENCLNLMVTPDWTPEEPE